MTNEEKLNSSIKRYEIWSTDDRISPYIREEHKQMVEWLKDYKLLLEQSNSDEDCIKLFDKIKEEIYDITDTIKVNPDNIFKMKIYLRLSDVIDVIEKHEIELPSIQPKQKTDEPMQVELEGDGYADNGHIYYDYGKCPKCGWQFEYGEKDWEEPYCCHCGQKLHWFESEEQE